MASDGLSSAGVTAPAAGMGAADDLQLLRNYEPVLRFTRGELFLPMPVEGYLGNCSLWRSAVPGEGGARDGVERLCTPGELTPGSPGSDQCGDRAGPLASVCGAPARPERVPRVAA